MKKLLLLLSLLASAVMHSQAKTDLKTDGLSGKVKKLTRFSFTVDSNGEKYIVTKSIIDYNEKGLKTKDADMVKPQQQDAVGNKTLFDYDASGNLTEMRWYSSDTVLTNKRVMVYNDKNQMVEEKEYSQNGRMSQKKIFTYDEKGNEAEMQLWISDTYFVSKSIRKYDERGNMLSLGNYGSKDILNYEYCYKYDLANNKTEKIYWTPAKVEKTEMKYDSQNNRIESLYFENGKLVLKESLQYDANNKVIETVYDYSSSKGYVIKNVRKRNEQGDVIESLEYNNGILRRKEVVKYTYDSNGNWIIYTQWVDDGGPGNIGRIIEYYN